MKTIYVFTALIGLLSLLNSCSKDESGNGTSTLSIYMTDDPASYDAVNIDIQQVEIKSNTGTVNLNVNAGIYNLLDFANGLDTLIATGSLESGTVSQIRLILGTNNTVVVDGQTYPLSTPSAQQSGLKLQVHEEFLPGVAYSLLLDFDANQSIVDEGNGSYQLKPVIRVIETAISGSVKGIIVPTGINCTVTASGNGQTYSTICDSDGNFLLHGLPAGVYDITLDPEFPYSTVTLSNVSVTVGNVTDVGIINL